ncbi:MAG TPA: NAD(P)-dependent alcohol dehydrogenase [Ktedonobacterales bacterium]|nr:NAD(P)-dependent alcohol dehydrogenase [Ktedonobacterales bacterium]
MKAVQVFGYNQPVKMVDVPEPKIESPTDVIIRVGGAGVCRTDLHILEGIWRQTVGDPALPYTIGHENAGWVEAVGSAVTTLKRGDPVILHPQPSCGLCRACRAGNDMHCVNAFFPGLDGHPGGYAEYMKTSIRAVVPLAPGTDPIPLAPYADAGITAYHAVKKIAPETYPGSVVAVIGVGGLGHFAVQLLKVMTTAKVVAVDTTDERLAFAKRIGADHGVLAGTDGGVKGVVDYSNGGADIVMDFVGEKGTPEKAMAMLRKGGTYSIIGYGGTVAPTTLQMIFAELKIVGNLVGSYTDLSELMELAHQGKVHITSSTFPLADANDVLHDLDAGKIEGRAVLMPEQRGVSSAEPVGSASASQG